MDFYYRRECIVVLESMATAVHKPLNAGNPKVDMGVSAASHVCFPQKQVHIVVEIRKDWPLL